MEEPPRIEKILSSQGVSLSDTAMILQAYLATIDHHHHRHPSEQPAHDDDDDNDDDTVKPRKSRQEMQEEALLKQMDQLSKKSSGMVSDDIYERLKMIRDSICGEVNGVPLMPSAARTAMEQSQGADDNSDDGAARAANNGAEDFLAELEEADRLTSGEGDEQTTTQQQQPPQVKDQSRKDKKKEKKEKKAAKKLKKESKRKARESLESNGDGMKRVKLEDS
eukprot:g4019.t1 g4019   contig15:163675-164340(+)